MLNGSSFKKVLVTGGTGYIGQALVERLLREDCSVFVLTRDKQKKEARELVNKGCTVFQGRIEDKAVFDSLQQVDEIFHLAADLGFSSDRDILWETNVNGTRNVLDFAIRRKIKKFIFISSIEVTGYVETSSMPVDELYPCRPLGFYGETKLAAEELIKEYGEKKELPFVILRIGTVYGENDRGRNIIYWLIYDLYTTSEVLKYLPLYKDICLQFIHMLDLIDGIWKASLGNYNKGKTYFLVGDEYITVQSLIQLIAFFLGNTNIEEYINSTLPLLGEVEGIKEKNGMINYLLSGEGDRIHHVYSNKRAKQEFGFSPKTSLEKGIGQTIVSYYQRGLLNSYQRFKWKQKERVKVYLDPLFSFLRRGVR